MQCVTIDVTVFPELFKKLMLGIFDYLCFYKQEDVAYIQEFISAYILGSNLIMIYLSITISYWNSSGY